MTAAPAGIGTLDDIVLDCPDPWTLGRFWSAVVGLPLAIDSEDSWVTLVGGPKLSFQRVEGYEAPTWPDGAPQQIHLDVKVADLDVAHKLVESLGAKVLSDTQCADKTPWRVYADPAGHPFCLVT